MFTLKKKANRKSINQTAEQTFKHMALMNWFLVSFLRHSHKLVLYPLCIIYQKDFKKKQSNNFYLNNSVRAVIIMCSRDKSSFAASRHKNKSDVGTTSLQRRNSTGFKISVEPTSKSTSDFFVCLLGRFFIILRSDICLLQRQRWLRNNVVLFLSLSV